MIDEKGRLFGKINIIDLLVILLVLAVAVVVGLKLMGKGGVLPGGDNGVRLEYTVKVPKVSPAVYEALKVYVDTGDTQLMANGSMLNGEILSVTATTCIRDLETADGKVVYTEDPGLLDLVFTIQATVTNPITQEVGTQEVRIGKTHIVKTQDFELMNGTILTCAPVEAAG